MLSLLLPHICHSRQRQTHGVREWMNAIRAIERPCFRRLLRKKHKNVFLFLSIFVFVWILVFVAPPVSSSATCRHNPHPRTRSQRRRKSRPEFIVIDGRKSATDQSGGSARATHNNNIFINANECVCVCGSDATRAQMRIMDGHFDAYARCLPKTDDNENRKRLPNMFFRTRTRKIVIKFAMFRIR